MQKPDNALELRHYESWSCNFKFYVTSYPTERQPYYRIYRFIDCINGAGGYEYTIGDPNWVNEAKIIERYNK